MNGNAGDFKIGKEEARIIAEILEDKANDILDELQNYSNSHEEDDVLRDTLSRILLLINELKGFK